MLTSGPARRKALADLTDAAIVPVRLAAMFVTFLLTLAFILALPSAFLPHMSGLATFLLVLVAFPLAAVGVCKLTALAAQWPWYDTLVAALWIAWEADGSRGHPWPSWIIAPTSVLVLSALLRWVQYALVPCRSIGRGMTEDR